MRTLLIDNYDSFTFNLFHYLAEVTGVEPVVVRNDDPRWRPSDVTAFDGVVISPGPGRPDRPADFGICAEVISQGRVPLLGVCLGHQGLCHLAGGEIGPAPEVRHGRLSPILHTGVDILAGLPSPFAAVRYHSLIATAVPDELEPIGWTPDGVLMAVRHRHRPAWGVQFHPESIATEHGHQILRNFVDLARRWRERRAAPVQVPEAPSPLPLPLPPRSPSPSAPARSVDPPPPVDAPLRLLHRRLPVDVCAEAVFGHLYAASPYAFWLDSSGPAAGGGRFSFMGDAAGPLARLATADVWAGTVRVESADGVQVSREPFFDWLAEDLRRHRIDTPGLPFDFALGWVGYLGYELKAECGGELRHRSDHPDAQLVFADRAIAFDHREATVHLLALAGPDADADTAALRWLEATARELSELAGPAGGPEPHAAPPAGTPAPPAGSPAPPAGSPAPPAGSPAPPLLLRHDRDRYLELIRHAQRLIAAGETYEACLTNMVTAAPLADPLAAYRRLRRESPAPYAALLRLGPVSVLSSSPERLLRVSADGWAESRPIKGTRPRASSGPADDRLRIELAGSEKDRAENLMIVDLVRHDLGSCARVGSVEVPALYQVESFATVHQLVSTVRARLRPDSSAVACARAVFPGGSMTGAPKIRTMRILDALEGGARGVYSGALGYFSLTGAADLSVVIRTLVAGPDRTTFGVGGAIIALSEPGAEFEETAVKATAMLRLLGADFPGRAVEPSRC